MNVWKIHIKSDSEQGIDPRQCCIKRGIIGVGWRTLMDFGGDSHIQKQFEEAHKNDYRRAADIVKNELELGDLVWAKDSKGDCFLGRITDQRCDTLKEPFDTYAANTRKCDWYKMDSEDALPKELIDFFVRPASIDRIDSDAIKEFSRITYKRKSNSDV